MFNSMKIKRGNVEENIIRSAKELFLKKGYRETTMRAIAKEADVNLAMLNYYFRSKENLFEIIFDDVFSSMSKNITPILLSDLTVLEKIERFVKVYIDGLRKNPAVPNFIFQEVRRNPNILTDRFRKQKEFVALKIAFEKQIKEEVEQGLLREIDNPNDLYLNITSLCAFPFLVKPIAENLLGEASDEFEQIIERRTETVISFIYNNLKP